MEMAHTRTEKNSAQGGNLTHNLWIHLSLGLREKEN